MKYLFVILFLSVFQFCNHLGEQPKSIGEQTAMANGLQNFDKVELLEFVFNVQRDTAKASKRHWQWYPKTNKVIFFTDSGDISFQRYDTTTPELKKLNARFTNDEYWLLFPYHLYSDKGMALADSSEKTAPIAETKMRKLSAKYNEIDGFTPGDKYDVYIDKDLQIKEWAYTPAGSAEPKLMTTWQDYKNYNGLMLAQDHRSKDGKFRIWFTGIKVKLL